MFSTIFVDEEKLYVQTVSIECTQKHSTLVKRWIKTLVQHCRNILSQCFYLSRSLSKTLEFADFLAMCLKDKIKEFRCVFCFFLSCFVLLAHIAVIMFHLIALDLENVLFFRFRFRWCVNSFIIYEFSSIFRSKLFCLENLMENIYFANDFKNIFLLQNRPKFFTATYANTHMSLVS
jgi:hypothetical protein